jgi:hypothetical protein
MRASNICSEAANVKKYWAWNEEKKLLSAKTKKI